MKNFSILLLIALVACQPASDKKPENKIQKLAWLLASWRDSSADGMLYEIWSKKNDSTFEGKGFMLSNNHSVFSETMTLQQSDSGLYYIPTVKNQNEGKAVSFKLISDSGAEFTFENKVHDFPQRVIYSNPGPDSLYARIEGEENGKFRKEEFRLVKQ